MGYEIIYILVVNALLVYAILKHVCNKISYHNMYNKIFSLYHIHISYVYLNFPSKNMIYHTYMCTFLKQKIMY